MSKTIARPQIHPRIRELIARTREETFATQEWRPACGRCGEQADRELVADEARAWRKDHECSR